MKRAFLILSLVLISLTFENCSKSDSDSNDVQTTDLEGTWGITALTYVLQSGTQNVYINEIKNGQAVNDFFFMKDGKFKQISDMSGSGTTETYEGTWKISGTKLTITLFINGMQTAVEYACEQKDDLLTLIRKSPDFSESIIITFRKKR